jgi:DNA-binding CsgD family transcriptional regulator
MIATDLRVPGRTEVRARGAGDDNGVDHNARRVLRELVKRIGRPAPTHDEEEVVLCAEVDGMRYTLLQQRVPDGRRAVRLSAREREIARLISGGHTNKTVAAVLEISLWTVDTHIRRIFTKLGVRSRSAMVAQLAELGLLDRSGR